MKKILSLILAVMMLLGCMSVTAFAAAGEPGVVIAGTILTADGIVSNNAITSGTVTYTAASGGNPAKLILEDAVIGGPCEAPIISVNDLNLEIELIGNNQVTAGSNAAVMSKDTELTITGSGSLIIHGNGGEGSVAIKVKGTDGITLSEGYKAVGSTSTTEKDISSMTEATFSTENKTYMVGEAVAQTVAIYNSNAASGKSGTTDITAVKAAAPLSYEMVIPSAVNMTEAGIVEIGTPSVEDVENATEKTVISYTASGTQLTLEGDSKTMTTSYYTDSTGTTAMPSTAIEVYKSKTLVDPLTTLYVGVAQADWDAAEAGTYNATVTFNFATEEAEAAVVTIGDILDTLEGHFPAFNGDVPANAWTNGNKDCMMFTCVLNSVEYLCPLAEPMILTTAEPTKISDKVYSYSQKVLGDSMTITLTFNLNDSGVLENIVLSGADEGNGTYTWPQK